MASELTKAQQQVLEACPDWSACFEIRNRKPSRQSYLGLRMMLGRLRNLGFVEWSSPNDTWRVTDLGRTALAHAAEGRTDG